MLSLASISFTLAGLTALLTHPVSLAVAACLWPVKAMVGLALWRHWKRRRASR